jgi:hypothetical protein
LRIPVLVASTGDVLKKIPSIKNEHSVVSLRFGRLLRR